MIFGDSINIFYILWGVQLIEKEIRILIVDDHQILREGLKALLAKEPDMEVVAEAEDGRDALRLARELKPHVVILDITLPGLNGIEVTRQILAEDSEAKVVALSIHTEKTYVSEMLSAGAKAYLPKGTAFAELSKAVHAVVEGQIYLAPSVTGTLVKDYLCKISEGSNRPVSHKLSSREREVLQLLTEGMSAKDIADFLHISRKTVESHRRRIMDKLGIQNIAQLTKFAIREGLTTLNS